MIHVRWQRTARSFVLTGAIIPRPMRACWGHLETLIDVNVMKMLKWAAAAVVAMFCAAAITPKQAHAQTDVRPQRPRQERNRIRADEIAQANSGSVYQLIQNRRGMWLMRSTQATDLTGSAGKMLVYLDGAKLDGIDDLRQIPAAGVRMVEFLTPGETEHRLGEYTSIGTIRVVTRDEPQADSAHAGHD